MKITKHRISLFPPIYVLISILALSHLCIDIDAQEPMNGLHVLKEITSQFNSLAFRSNAIPKRTRPLPTTPSVVLLKTPELTITGQGYNIKIKTDNSIFNIQDAKAMPLLASINEQNLNQLAENIYYFYNKLPNSLRTETRAQLTRALLNARKATNQQAITNTEYLLQNIVPPPNYPPPALPKKYEYTEEERLSLIAKLQAAKAAYEEAQQQKLKSERTTTTRQTAQPTLESDKQQLEAALIKQQLLKRREAIIGDLSPQEENTFDQLDKEIKRLQERIAKTTKK